MIAKAGKKILAIMMALTLVLGNVPAIAFAASAGTNPLQDGTLAVSYEGTAVKVDEANGIVRVEAVPTMDASSLIPFYEGTTVTITLINQNDTQKILCFDYSVQGNKKDLTIGGQAYSGTGTWTGVVDAGASVDVVLSGNDTDGLAKIAMGNFRFYDNDVKNVTFAQAANGTVTAANAESTYENGVAAEAVADAGYQFVAWVDENNQILSTEANTTLHPVQDCTVKAVFAAAEEPYFKAAGKLFTDLNEAAAYASESGTGVVVPLKDGTIPAGNYNIPVGVTLLVPFNAEETCYLDKPQTAGTEFTEPVTYCKLTFADGANLTVEGELSVSAKHTSGYNSTKTGGTPTDSVGMIDLKKGSTITLTKGASAYAWGYIIGSGNIIAESGSKVYEIMQIADFRGGSQTLNLLSTPVLPFSQYYIQNIEAPLTLHGGAEEYAFTTLTATTGGMTVTSSAGIQFIGTKDAMFALEEGTTVTKTYNPETDRLMLETNGNFALNSMSLTAMGQTMNTAGFNLPINNNISIDIQSGNAVIKQNTAFQPGVEISVGKDASVSVAEQITTDENGNETVRSTSIYIYDTEEWGGYTFGGAQFADIAYSPTKAYTRTVEKDIKDVVFDVNGRFVVEQNAYVYTTASGAQVISSEGTGSVEFQNPPGVMSETVQADGNGTLVAIPITPMKLQNQDGSYVETASVAAGDGFVVDNGTWIPATDVTLTYDANGGEFIGASSTQSISKQNVLAGVAIELRDAGSNVTKTGFQFDGWNTEADGSGKSYSNKEKVRFVKDTVLYAQWKEQDRILTFETDGGTTIDPIEAQAGSKITKPENPTKEGYIFERWEPELPDVMPNKNKTYTAIWTPIEYTITFDTDGGSEVAPITQGYETALTKPAAPTKEGYTFIGWDKEFPETMPLGGMELKATWELTKNVISFDTDGGSEVTEIKGYYGDAVTEPAAPTKEGYTFIGWDKEFPETMPAENLTLKAQWKVNQYTVSFDTDGGSTVSSMTEDYGTLLTPPVAPVREGYTFVGWTPEFPDKMPAKNLTLTAQWKVNQYTIIFDTDGGSEVAAITADYGSKVTAPAAPTKEGHTFTGWDVEIPETMPAEYLTIRATWDVNEYTVSFDTAGGSQVAAVTEEFGTEITMADIAAPTKEGFIFQGWEYDDELVGSSFTIPAQNVTLKAVWEEDAKVTVTFMDDDGTEYPVIGKTGQALTVPQLPVKEGYTLTWAPEAPSVFPAQDETYYAVWEVNKYTITFDTDGGSAVASMTVDYDATVVAPKNPEKAGYVFTGWTPALPGKMPAKDLTVKARYIKVLDAPVVTVSENQDKGNALSWNAVEGAAKYDVYRSTAQTTGFQKVTTVTSTGYTDTAVAAGSTYYYYVVAIHGDTAAANSAQSNVVSAHYHNWTAATCEAPKTCKACSVTEGSALGHDYQDVVTKKATTTKDGKITETCSVCGDVAGTAVIRKASKISLSTSSYTYNGKTKSPKVYVKDSKGKTISSKNYKVTTPSGRKSIGTYTYKITFKEQYSGSKTLTLTIKPKTTTIKTPSAAKKAITVKWTKGSSSQVSGYEILLATNSKFTKGKKTVTVKGYKTTSKKVTKLKSKTKYYVKVRTYKTVKGKKVYSDWSKTKSVKAK